MALGILQRIAASQLGLSARAVGLISTNEALKGLFKAACRASGVPFKHVRTTSRLHRKLQRGSIAALVWDQATVEMDREMIAEVAGDVPVILLAADAPSALGPAALPPGAAATPPECAPQIAKMVARSVAGGRRVENLEGKLEQTQGELEATQRMTQQLREHCDFYELQRNRLSEMVRRTAYLGQLSKEINCLDIDRIVEICIEKMPRIVDAGLVSIYFCDEENRELILSKSNHPYPLTERVSLDESPAGLMAVAVKRKATLLIRDIDAFRNSLGEPIDLTYKKKYVTNSCIIVPLTSGDKILAVLNLADKVTGEQFDEISDLPLVDHISQFIGIALRNCQLYDEVSRQARSDGLTGFINHNAFYDELHREVERSRRTGSNVSLVMLDVDNFKLFNDVHGHQVGDSILKEVARMIKQSVRAVDIPARYGGDEFAVILCDTDLNRGLLVAERIRRAVASGPMLFDGKAFSITVSAGIAQYKPGQTPADLVKKVDEALYEAKSKGRNAVAVRDAEEVA
ncbi:MAG: sensor domain-containing diguanylate cyclase [Planctomycetota bacterium]|jgi:diguanylate cyclase (GGDEF)-like protein